MTWLSVLQTQTDLFSCNIIDGIFHRAPRGTRANQEQWHQLPYTAHTSAHSRYFASSTMSGLKSESFPHTILRCTYGRSSWQLNTPDSSLQRKGGHHHLFVCSKDRVSRFYCMLPWINLLLERAPAPVKVLCSSKVRCSSFPMSTAKQKNPFGTEIHIYRHCSHSLTHISPLCSRHHDQGAEYRCKFFPTAALYSRET